MMILGLLFVSTTALAARCSVDPHFPPWFKLGVATSSYQIEGAWNVSDKAESIWDVFTHDKPDGIEDHSTGDVACDSYHQWERDVQMASEMGLDFYRLSISWPRLLPKGFDYNVSKDGAQYYNNIIDGLLACGIEPMITLYHWDLPEVLQELGGWANPLVSDWFASYARVVFSLYGDRVKTWVTINEPVVMCDIAYDTGMLAPGIEEPYAASYICNKNILLAHAKAWRIYDREFKPLYHGKVSIANHIIWFDPQQPQYSGLTDMVLQYVAGRYFHPIYSTMGGWPPGLEQALAGASDRMEQPRGNLPPFTEYEKNLVRGTYDFMAFNYYTSRVVRPAKPGEKIESTIFNGIAELDAVATAPPSASYGRSKTMPIYPEGLRKTLRWLKTSYGDITIVITENGYSSSGSNLEDTKRISYIRDHLEQVLFSIKLDRVRVAGYAFWSLMDNFEWADGYMTKYGLYEVDFSDPMRTRTPRSSARYYADIIKYRQLDICSN